MKIPKPSRQEEMDSPPSVIPIDFQGLGKDSGSSGMMAAADTKND